MDADKRSTRDRAGRALRAHDARSLSQRYHQPASPSQATPHAADQLAALLALPPDAGVLDAGCGAGGIAIRLAAVPYRLRITGVDVLAGNLNAARRRARRSRVADRAVFWQMDFARLAFPDDTFAGAYTVDALAQHTRIDDVLAGLYRVLRPRGRLVLFERLRPPAPEASPGPSQLSEPATSTSAAHGCAGLGRTSLDGLLARAGFTGVRCEELTLRGALWRWGHRNGRRYLAYTCTKPIAPAPR